MREFGALRYRPLMVTCSLSILTSWSRSAATDWSLAILAAASSMIRSAAVGGSSAFSLAAASRVGTPPAMLGGANPDGELGPPAGGWPGLVGTWADARRPNNPVRIARVSTNEVQSKHTLIRVKGTRRRAASGGYDFSSIRND